MYKNHSVEAGVKGEVGYRVAYVKGIHKVKQGFSELTTVNEMGMRSPRDMEIVKTVGWAVLETAAVGIFAFVALPAIITTFTSMTVGLGSAVARAFIASKELILILLIKTVKLIKIRTNYE